MTIDLEKLTIATIIKYKDTDLLCKLSADLFTGNNYKLYTAIESYYCDFSKVISVPELNIKVPNSEVEEWLPIYDDFIIEGELLRTELESSRARNKFIDCIIAMADDIEAKTASDLTEELSTLQMSIADLDSFRDEVLADAVDIDVDEYSEETFSSGLCSTYDESCGGFENQSVISISGTRGSGKSIILQNLANHHFITHKNTVLFANIEMAKVTVRQRQLSMISGVPHSDIKHGATDIQKCTIEAAKAKFFYKNNSALNSALISLKDNGLIPGREAIQKCTQKDERMLYLDDAGLTISKLDYHIKAIKKKHNLKLVCVDYLQIIKDSNKEKGTPDWLAQTLIAVQLKEIAKREDIIIVTAAQIHTDGGTKRALAIEDSLDVSLKFFPGINPTTGEKTDMIKVYNAKSRDSQENNFFIQMDWPTLSLVYNANQSAGFDDEDRKDIRKA